MDVAFHLKTNETIYMQSDKSTFNIGIIGCGKISQAYFKGAKLFPILNIVACADIHHPAAEAQAAANDCQALSVDDLLAHPEIDLVINLTIPAAHVPVSLQALEAGKHVYLEKPLAMELAEGRKLMHYANEKGLRVGCAPDTFLGAGQQTCRHLVDAGAIGQVVAGTAFMLSSGPESWHPNPGFFYLRGGGPVLDMAPYYLTTLVNLLGPIKRVGAIAGRSFAERHATCSERFGEMLPVEVNTHASASFEFHSGAIITGVFSFDVPAHGHTPIELYGSEGSLKVPDPNTFGGQVQSFKKGGEKIWHDQALTHPFTENSRGIGVADMVQAIQNGCPHRASGDLALHILEVMNAIDASSSQGAHIDIESRPPRPEAMEASQENR
jgi:predicted dehydrogenase